MFSTTCSMSLPGAAEIRSCFQLKNRLEWNLRRHGPRPQIAEASPYLHSWRRKTCQEFRKAWYIHKLTYYICIYIYKYCRYTGGLNMFETIHRVSWWGAILLNEVKFPVDFPINPMGQGAGASVEAHLAVTWHPKQSNTAKMAADCSICTKLWIYTMHIYTYIYTYIYEREKGKESNTALIYWFIWSLNLIVYDIDSYIYIYVCV